MWVIERGRGRVGRQARGVSRFESALCSCQSAAPEYSGAQRRTRTQQPVRQRQKAQRTWSLSGGTSRAAPAPPSSAAPGPEGAPDGVSGRISNRSSAGSRMADSLKRNSSDAAGEQLSATEWPVVTSISRASAQVSPQRPTAQARSETGSAPLERLKATRTPERTRRASGWSRKTPTKLRGAERKALRDTTQVAFG